MIVLRDPQQRTQIAQPDIKTFLQQRFHDICDLDCKTASNIYDFQCQF